MKNKTILEKMLNLQTAKSDSFTVAEPLAVDHDFYAMGRKARRLGLTVQLAMKRPDMWGLLQKATEVQVSEFVNGLYGGKRPAEPTPTPDPASPIPQPKPDPKPAPPVPAVQELEVSTPELSDLELLKTLVRILEARLTQPVQVNMPRVLETRATYERDAETNLAGNVTKYTYEE